MKHSGIFVALTTIFVLLAACTLSNITPTDEDSPPASEETGELVPTPIVTTPTNPLPLFACDNEQPPLVTGFDIFQPPHLPEPQSRLPFRDPIFGTCLIRVTDRNADLADGDSSAGLKNEYSRVQSFNADGTFILVLGLEATWYLYDAFSLQPLSQLPFSGPVDPRWSADNPNVIYYSEETHLMMYDTQIGTQASVHDFAADLPGYDPVAVWTRYEGSPSFDGKTWGLMAEDENWLTSAFIIYDLPSDRVVATLDTRGWADDAREIDSVTISPLGDYFLVYMDKYCEQSQSGTEENPCGLMVYDRNLKNGRGLLRLVGHSDIALDAQGREVLVYQDIDTDHISMLDLESGAITTLWLIDFSHTPIGLHISGRASLAPGWALISTYDGDPVSYTWMDDSVFAIELKPNGRIIRLAHTQSLVDESMEHDYWAEPQASVNRDFTRILFTSNWGKSGTGEVEMYLIQLPKDWLDYLP
jgi:hypothetical protein